MRMTTKKYIIIFVAGTAALIILAGVWIWSPALFSENGGGENQPENPTTESAPSDTDIFSHPDFRFSFALPDDFTVSESGYGEDATIITFEKSQEEGFQIFVAPFDEPGPLSPERIHIDEPDLVIKNSQQTTLDGISALAFESESEIGNTYEIWFIRNGKLYQITARALFEAELMKILKTWKFQE